MKLSEFELEVMQVIWRLGETTAPQVHAEIAARREISYSAVKTIIDRLERKGALSRVSQVGRTIVFGPAIAEEQVRSTLLRDYTARLFPGEDRMPLFNALFRERRLSREEIEYLQALLDEHDGTC